MSISPVAAVNFHSVVNGAKSVGKAIVSIPSSALNALLKTAVPSKQKPDYYVSPFGFETTKSVFHLAGDKGALALAYKVALFATLTLPLIVILDATVGNMARWTVGNLAVAVERRVISQVSKHKTYVWSPLKIGVAAAAVLALAGFSAYKYGVFPFRVTIPKEADKVVTPKVVIPKVVTPKQPWFSMPSILTKPSIPTMIGEGSGLLALIGAIYGVVKCCHHGKRAMLGTSIPPETPKPPPDAKKSS